MSGQQIWGWKGIAAHVGIVINTAIAYSRLCEDPLPVRMNRGTPWCYAQHLEEWIARRSGGVCRDGSKLERLDGWESIRRALGGVDLATAKRWAKLPHDRLPVMGIGTRAPWAYITALRDWSHRGDLPFQAHARIARVVVEVPECESGIETNAPMASRRRRSRPRIRSQIATRAPLR